MSAGVRCFLALLPDAASRNALQRCQRALQSACFREAAGVRWVTADALHLTLRFLGPTQRLHIEPLTHALPTLARPLPPVRCERHALWGADARCALVAELAPDPRLLELARDCEAQARAAGFTPESRPFRAHVTLARLDSRAPHLPLSFTLPRIELTFDRLALMESTLGARGATYTPLASATLA